MGPTDPPNKTHLQLDGIMIYNRESALAYVDQVRCLIEILWPAKEEEEEK
jgi:hypothetical protein